MTCVYSIGRRKSVLFSSVSSILISAHTILSPNVETFIFYRMMHQAADIGYYMGTVILCKWYLTVSLTLNNNSTKMTPTNNYDLLFNKLFMAVNSAPESHLFLYGATRVVCSTCRASLDRIDISTFLCTVLTKCGHPAGNLHISPHHPQHGR